MKVWEHIAKGANWSRKDVVKLISGFTACKVEKEIGYLGIELLCQGNCKRCMNKYLNTERDYIQLNLFNLI